MRPFVKWIACLCLLLTLGSAIGFATHMHADAAAEAHCAICVAAHTSSPAAPAILLLIATLAVTLLKVEPVAAAKQRLAVFALSVRPPPQARIS
jgi:hypothetical protein